MNEAQNTAPERKGVPMWAQIIIWVFLVGLLAIVAMGLRQARQPMAETGKPIPEMSFEFYEGYEFEGQTSVNISDLQGKVVILNVWASWCKPCEQEAPDLQAFWQEYQDRDVVLIGVDYVDTPVGAYSYLKKFQITFPNAPDLQSAISAALNRKMGVPETYFIDRHGVLHYVQVGPFSSVQQIKNIVDPMLAE